MSYALIIKDNHNLHADVVEIARFLNQRLLGLGSDFVVAFDDTLARMEARFEQTVQVKFRPKWADIYGEPIKAEKYSPVSSKKFQDYYVYYLLNEEKREAVILAVAYGPRDPKHLKKLLTQRR